MTVKLADVAREAGVSVSAASICLRHGEGFSPSTIQRVRTAADTLGYGVPAGPRPRTGQRTGLAAIVLNDDPHFALQCGHTVEIVRALSRELTQMGMGVALLPSRQDTEGTCPYRSVAADIAYYLAVSELSHETTAILRSRGIPTVHLQSVVGGPVAAVRTDDVTPMRELATHVLSLGHERVAVVTQRSGAVASVGLSDTLDWTQTRILHTRERLQGLDEAGVTPMAVYEARISAVEAGREAGATLFTMQPRPTAVMCLTDMLAAGVMVAAREAGLSVPGDVSITGWDGLDLPSLAPHRLTTVLQSGAQKGMLLAAFGREVLAGGHPRPFRVPQHVSIGSTTGRAP